jgi:hypothetical protein
LDFYYGNGAPGSNDVWVEASDDLSVTLLQARLIELRQPIRVVMEVATVIKEVTTKTRSHAELWDCMRDWIFADLVSYSRVPLCVHEAKRNIRIFPLSCR